MINETCEPIYIDVVGVKKSKKIITAKMRDLLLHNWNSFTPAKSWIAYVERAKRRKQKLDSHNLVRVQQLRIINFIHYKVGKKRYSRWRLMASVWRRENG